MLKPLCAYCISILFFCIIQQTYAVSLWTVREHNLSSFGKWEEEDWPNEPFYDFLMRCKKYQHEPMAIKKRNLTFNLVQKYAKENNCFQCSIVNDETTWKDLCLFVGQSDAKVHVGSLVDRTFTELGRVILLAKLASVDTDIQVLRNKQRVIQALVEDDDLRANLEQFLAVIAEHENFLLSFWGNDPFQRASRRHYFVLPYCGRINDGLNSSATLLETKAIAEHAQRFAWLASSVAAGVVLPVYGFAKMSGLDVPEELHFLAKELRGCGGALFPLLASLCESQLFHAFVSVVSGTYCLLNSREQYEWFCDNFVLDRCLQEKLIAVSQALDASHAIADRIDACDALRTTFFATKSQPIHAILNGDYVTTQALDNLLYLLSCHTFEGKASVFSNDGVVLKAYSLMHEIKDELLPLLIFVAEIDAYLSIARLYKESECKENGYCYVDFVESNAPVITMANFWNPFIDADRVVANSIELDGTQGPINVVLTGPNAAGKSTIIKGMAINLILAQAFGIAAAQRMTITPFSNIATYLNITDDLAAGNSLFKAGVLRAHGLLERIQQLDDTQFSFVAVDEIFNGTSPKEGAAAAYSVAKHLGTLKNSICIVATHFAELTQLEQDTDSFANYKVSVSIGDDGIIHYPFTLQRGASGQHVAIDILQAEGFDSAILNEAYSLIKPASLQNRRLQVS